MLPTIPVLDNKVPSIQIVIKAEEKPQTFYTIKEGDTLTSISKLYSVDLRRLWAANTTLTNPDVIEPLQSLRIPENEEVLPEREMPVTMVSANLSSETLRNSPPGGGFSNTYDFHSCTWHAKEMRPDLPNSLGNAYSWVSRAQALGIPTGYEARAGAVGQQGNHVVYIISMSGDRVYLSERNYDWNGSYRERWALASDFVYIY